MDWIRESNLIEGVDDPAEDQRSYRAWKWWCKQHPSLGVITAILASEILEAHRRIMLKKLTPSRRGHLRTVNVWVGPYQCPKPEDVPLLFQRWIKQHGNANTEEAIKAAHIAFEGIHPFIDGNGRTGRMLMNWQRVQAGYEPLLIEADKRMDYYRWFANV